MPNNEATSRFRCPAANSASTCRSRGVSAEIRSRIVCRSPTSSPFRGRAPIASRTEVSRCSVPRDFAQRSLAPALIAPVAIVVSAVPVNTMIGVVMERARSCSNNSTPLIPGRINSTTRQPGLDGSKALRNSSAETKDSTRKRADSNRTFSDFCMAGSSSITNTVGAEAVPESLLAGWVGRGSSRPRSVLSLPESIGGGRFKRCINQEERIAFPITALFSRHTRLIAHGRGRRRPARAAKSPFHYGETGPRIDAILRKNRSMPYPFIQRVFKDRFSAFRDRSGYSCNGQFMD